MSKRGGELDAGLLYQDTEVFKEFTYEDLGLGSSGLPPPFF